MFTPDFVVGSATISFAHLTKAEMLAGETFASWMVMLVELGDEAKKERNSGDTTMSSSLGAVQMPPWAQLTMSIEGPCVSSLRAPTGQRRMLSPKVEMLSVTMRDWTAGGCVAKKPRDLWLEVSKVVVVDLR